MKPPLLPLLLVSFLGSGCVAVAAAGVGAAATYGIVSFKNNEASREFGQASEKVWKASIQALKAQDYTIQGVPLLDGPKGEIDAREAVVTVERLSRASTQVSVRVGTFDSEANRRAAKLVIDEIARRLGE